MGPIYLESGYTSRGDMSKYHFRLCVGLLTSLMFAITEGVGVLFCHNYMAGITNKMTVLFCKKKLFSKFEHYFADWSLILGWTHDKKIHIMGLK